EWHIDGRQAFRIAVPAGTIPAMDDMPASTCWTEFTTDVNMQIWPGENADGQARLYGFVDGFVERSKLEDVEIRTGGNVIRFIDFFEGADPTIDSNGDGVNDAYPFTLSMEAERIEFNDPDETRNPDPPDLPTCP
ncbi:MAG: hypothetical protein KC549_03235, partial [Myxococcales bacterium]|nr:hypothetical protein [Myxococcales bacterium]